MKKSALIKKSTQVAKPKSNHAPKGDARLNANIREDLHLKLRIHALKTRTTVGELIEEWIDKAPWK